LDINDDLGLAELLGQALILATEFVIFFLDRTALGLRAALVRGQTFEDAGLPFATPGDEVRRVKALSALQGANGAGLGGGGIGFRQDAQFVFGGEVRRLASATTSEFGNASAAGGGATVLPAAELRSASLRSSCLRSAAGKTVGEVGEIPLFFTLIPILALLSN